MIDFSMIHLLLLCYIIAWIFDLFELILLIITINYIYRLYYNQRRFRAFRVNNDVNNCAICLETDKERSIKLNCGHIFHERCIREWTRIKPVCPLCRCKY
jgi:hypothetical protein